MKNLTKKELELLSDPLIAVLMLFGLFAHGIPTAYVSGVALMEGYREGTGFIVTWGGLITISCLYFLWLYVRTTRKKVAKIIQERC